MEHINGYHTLKGYSMRENKAITHSMEDYLEMMYRLNREEEVIRISKLSRMLNVRPSSASKMAGNLKRQGLVENPVYGHYLLTKKGKALGHYLVARHEIVHELLCFINQSDDELEQAEKIEHFFNEETVENIKKFLDSYRKK